MSPERKKENSTNAPIDHMNIWWHNSICDTEIFTAHIQGRTTGKTEHLSIWNDQIEDMISVANITVYWDKIIYENIRISIPVANIKRLQDK